MPRSSPRSPWEEAGLHALGSTCAKRAEEMGFRVGHRNLREGDTAGLGYGLHA